MTTQVPWYSGKVRDIYEVDDRHLLFVTSDRISVFDVVLREPIPDKGRVLTAFSAFWFDRLGDVVESHLVSTSLEDLPEGMRRPEWSGRVMLACRAEMLPIEAIVRGYVSGSAWKEYRSSGTIHGEKVPGGLLESSELPEPRFTPSTKATDGHDLNITRREARDLIGAELADEVERVSLEMYRRGAELAAGSGIIVADTKFEFGIVDGRLVVADEVLTPDSSRFWPVEAHRPGTSPPSFDKQPVRDALEATGWDKTPPPPPLGDDVVSATRRRYIDAYERVTGLDFSSWPGVNGAS